MKKTFNLEDLECAHCAAKMEDGIKKGERKKKRQKRVPFLCFLNA